MVLTTAYCAQSSYGSIHVRGGSYRRETKGERSPVKIKLQHENFDMYNFHNDIGLLLLEKPLRGSGITLAILRFLDTIPVNTDWLIMIDKGFAIAKTLIEFHDEVLVSDTSFRCKRTDDHENAFFSGVRE